MKKKMLKLSIIILLLLFIFGGIISVQKVEGGFLVKYPIVIPYTYTIYEDHVELNKYCGKSETVKIPDKILGKPVTSIGEDCFFINEKISKVVLHENIEQIGQYAFVKCTNLIEVTGGENVKEIGRGAFWRCRNLEVADLGNKIEKVENTAFAECSKLDSIGEQKNLVYIGVNAFRSTEITDICLNDNVEIRRWAFHETPWLESQPDEFVLAGNGQLIYYNGSEAKIVVPDNVRTIVGGAFDGLKDVEVYIPESVVTIEAYSFDDCENIKVYIPASATEIATDEGNMGIEMWNTTSFTIVTTQDSCAHKYALERGVLCEIVDEIEYPQ